MGKITKQKGAFLAKARGPGEQAYRAVLTLDFLADPKLDFDGVRAHLFDLFGGNLGGLTMSTKRLPTFMELTRLELPCRKEGCLGLADERCGYCDGCCGHARGVCARKG